MDIFTIEATVLELEKLLAGSLVNKVHQPARDDLILRLWNGSREIKLLISASPRFSRIHLTERSFPNPFTPPRFCQLLRARLKRLKTIAQDPGERIVRMVFGGEGEEEYVLVSELFGRHANLILLDGRGLIVDSLKRVSEEQGARILVHGEIYRSPTSPVLIPLAGELPDLPEMEGGEVARWLLNNVRPMSHLVAKNIESACSCGLSPQNVIEEFRREWLEKKYSPFIALFEGKPILSPFPLPYLELRDVRSFPSICAAADHFYHQSVFDAGVVGGRSELDAAVAKGLKRLSSRLRNIRSEQETIEESDRQRQLGELLLANLHKVRKGMDEVTLDDFFQDPPASTTIPLDPLLSPQENAERYFKTFKKGKRGIGHVSRRIEETLQEQAWLEGVAFALGEAKTAGELLAVRRELEEAGLIRTMAEPASRRRVPDPKDQLRSALTPGGYTLFWGKNNTTNDFVSKRMTSDDDLWFHAKDMPGCHLVLKRGDSKGEVPEEDLLFAAALAAGHSRGRDGAKVEVIVALGKEVRKPRGARPGLVTVEHYRSVVVAPLREVKEIEP